MPNITELVEKLDRQRREIQIRNAAGELNITLQKDALSDEQASRVKSYLALDDLENASGCYLAATVEKWDLLAEDDKTLLPLDQATLAAQGIHVLAFLVLQTAPRLEQNRKVIDSLIAALETRMKGGQAA